MSTTASWITRAAATLGLAGRVRRVDEPVRSEVLGRITAAFVAKPDARFWWEHLTAPSSSWQVQDGYEWLPRLVPDPDADCWLVTGLEDDDPAVFRCSPAVAAAVLRACPHFEYAVVDPSLRWMVIENHHDVLIAAGDAAAWLDRLRE